MEISNLVSVVLTTFNGLSKGYIFQTIESILAQTHRALELIIIDDGSTDQTEIEIKKTFHDARITYIYQPNSGVSKARNTGITLAKGHFICIVDDDDIWLENKLELQLQAFQQNPDWMMQYCAISRIDAKGNFLNYQYHEATEDFYKKMILANQVDATSGVMVRKQAFEKVGIFAEITQGAEDYELWIRIAKRFRVGSLSTPLVWYRVHQNNDSKNIQKIKIGLLSALDLIVANDYDLDKKLIFHTALLNLANKAFEIGAYSDFRQLVDEIKQYGVISSSLRVKYVLSFFPLLVTALRKIR